MGGVGLTFGNEVSMSFESVEHLERFLAICRAHGLRPDGIEAHDVWEALARGHSAGRQRAARTRRPL